MHPIKKSLLLVTNVSCSPTYRKSTDVPPSLYSYRRSHLSASIAETGNEQHCGIITSDGILFNEIDRYYDCWRSLKVNLPGQGQWHALTAICWPCLLCLSLSRAVSKNHWQSIGSQESKRMYCMRRRIKKEEEEHASN